MTYTPERIEREGLIPMESAFMAAALLVATTIHGAWRHRVSARSVRQVTKSTAVA